jgi:lysyl-tRNA synthetase class 2
MLEWYRAESDYRDLLVDVKALMTFVAGEVLGKTLIRCGGEEIDLAGPWEYLTVANAFARHAGWNPVEKCDPDRFDEDMAAKVEPALPRHCPVVLADYPAHAAALARLKQDDSRVAERWELYVGGIELVNAFSELNNPAEQGARLRKCAAQRSAAGKEVYPTDESFIAALGDMPAATGAALGVDRLVMLLTGSPSLDAVLPFREPGPEESRV